MTQKVERDKIQKWAIWILIVVALVTGMSITMQKLKERKQKAVVPDITWVKL